LAGMSTNCADYLARSSLRNRRELRNVYKILDRNPKELHHLRHIKLIGRIIMRCKWRK
jgi:hypothetical protein